VGKSLSGSRILVLGVAYKRDIDDMRESPALEVIRLLQLKGADVAYHDPFCPTIRDDGHTELLHLPLHSLPLNADVLGSADLVLLITDHTTVDYQLVADHADLVLDARGTMRGLSGRARIIGLSGSADTPEAAGRHRSWADVAATVASA
jgi:UDP-N-acetyl-D-glucosamine dehydrogenase